MRRPTRLLATLARWLVYAVLTVLVLVGSTLLAIQTGWAKDGIRRLIVHQANQYLTATLSIGRLQGSFVRGIELGDVQLSREGRTLISIEEIALSYSIRELFDRGTAIRRIRLTRPHFVAQKQADGRWDLAALIKRDAREQNRRGPQRPIHLQSVEITDGVVSILNPVSFGAAHIPTEYHDLDLSFSFDYEPVAWRLAFDKAAWTAAAPDLRMSEFSGEISNGKEGWGFKRLFINTPKSRFTVDGLVARTQPTTLDLSVHAEQFAFQEFAGILTGLKNLGVEAQFDTHLRGPLDALVTDLQMQSTGGNVSGTFVLNSRTPGWQAHGEVDVERFELARWLSRPDRSTDITGHLTFGLTDVGLRAGGRLPIGTYEFDGSHARFMDYAADRLRARGAMTDTATRIDEATGIAYGASLRVSSGSIAIDSPYPFTFVGHADGVDLRRVPKNVPVPHVESTLAFDYDVTGQFSSSFIKGRARFNDSVFLGARVANGAVGSIDTSTTPFRYDGEGDLARVNLHRFGEGLDVGWLREPRYDGVLDGHFRVEGAGSESATMTLSARGHVDRATLFNGELSGDTTLEIAGGSLEGSFTGRISTVDPSIPFEDDRYKAVLTGTGHGEVKVRDLLVRSPEIDDYAIATDLMLEASTIRGVPIDSGTVTGELTDGTFTFTRLQATSPSFEASADGTLEIDDKRSSRIDYTVTRADLAFFKDLIGREISGDLVTSGQMTGPISRLHLVGEGTLGRVETSGVTALSAELKYDASVPSDAPAQSTGKIDGRITFVQAFGQEIQDVTGSATYDAGKAETDLTFRREGLTGAVKGTFVLHPGEQAIDLVTATTTIQRSSWTLASTGRPRVSWNDRGVTLESIVLNDAAGSGQRLTVDGTWFPAGGGNLHVTAAHVSLDQLTSAGEGPSRYGGFADFDATIRGTRERPLVTGQVTVTDGRVWRVAYQMLKGSVDFTDGEFQIDLRLDQSPGVWLTAKGSVPIGVFYTDQPDRPMDVAIASSSISLGLLEGATNIVRDVSGEMTVDVHVIGTTKDPHFDGKVDIMNAGFVVADSGAQYKNGRLAAQLAQDRVTVSTLHVEDTNGDPLDVDGSLATHELRVGDLSINVSAREFEVLRNEYGRMDVNARVTLRGQFESPRLSGRVTVTGGQLNVDAILDRTMLQSYSVQPQQPEQIDPIAALNPWQRLGVEVELNVPNTLRLLGENVQLSPGTPLGLGDFNLRAIGDLFLYKDPGQPMYVTGSLDSVTGTYAFQGRRFDLDPASSINFRGDLNPELYVSVVREISGVDTRVTIAGLLNQPELRLSSTPPLEPSDILSLVVFNTSSNQLSSSQQGELAVRAGALAAGFLAAPILTAFERSLGLETLEILPPTEVGGGARVTIGNEIAPGLIARFSRQFGDADYDEATLEYYLSRILRIRATFSDAGVTRSPFRRVERAGIDLLLFFSF